MLKRTSRFVLEVLPFLLSALIAIVLVPGVLYSRAHGLEAGIGQGIPALSQNASPSVRRNDAALPRDTPTAPRPASACDSPWGQDTTCQVKS